ncbi:MAG: PAS domain-containing protein [Bacteroidota bacterium]
MSFVPPGTLEGLSRMPEMQLNTLDFGVVKVDDNGVVQFYNHYESNMSGFSPAECVGKNFFTDVAPCTNNRLFLGRFKNGVSGGSMNDQFRYTFTYKMKPTNVQVHLYRDPATQSNYVLVKKA